MNAWDKSLDFLMHIEPFWIYLSIFGCAFAEVVFPPFPGDVLVILGGIMTRIKRLSFFWIYANSVAGAFTAALIVFTAGYLLGEHVLNNKWSKRLLPEDKRAATRRWLQRHSCWYLTVSRFFPGVRSGVILSSGVFRISRMSAFFCIFAGIAVYNALLVSLGHFLAGHIGYLEALWKWINRGLLGLSIFVLAAVLCIRFFKRRKERA
ncbi:MAG: DedA family protein [Bacillota bacterium]